MTKKQKTWTGVKLSAMGILIKKPKFWTAVNLSAMGISVFFISFSFLIDIEDYFHQRSIVHCIIQIVCTITKEIISATYAYYVTKIYKKS